MARRTKQPANRRILEMAILFLAGTWLLIMALKAGTEVAVPYDHDQLIDQYARKYDLDKSLVAALIYQESRYREGAVSKVGATGLMQIMPDTARWITGRLGVDYTKSKLKDPEFNISLGTYYLRYLMDKYGGDEELVLAAYNAGPGNVDAWLKNDRYSSGGRLTAIPFKETRDYVPRVIQMKGVYRSLYAKSFRVAP